MRPTILCEGDDAALEVYGRALGEMISASGADPGLCGRELAVILDALGTGMLLGRYLDPHGGHTELLTRAVRKLIADSGPASDRSSAASDRV